MSKHTGTDRICQKKFFSSGPWAVVDGFSGAIWITVENKMLVDLVSQAMAAKLNATPLDISQTANYTAELIDNSVVLNWSLEKRQDAYVNGIVAIPKQKYQLEELYSTQGLRLLNHVEPTALSQDQREELLSQIVSFLTVIKTLWPHHYCYGESIPVEDQDLLESIMYHYSVELTTQDIEARLLDLGQDNMHRYPQHCFNLLWVLGEFFD